MEKINSRKRPCENCGVKSGTRHKKVCAWAYVTRRTPHETLTQEQIQAIKTLTNMNIIKVKTDLEYLSDMLSDGDIVYTNLVKQSKSGTTHHIKVLTVLHEQDGTCVIVPITFTVSKALGLRYKDEAVIVGGGGMDMGYKLVHDIATATGKTLKQRWI